MSAKILKCESVQSQEILDWSRMEYKESERPFQQSCYQQWWWSNQRLEFLENKNKGGKQFLNDG